MQRRIEGSAGAQHAVGDVQEFSHHVAEDQHRWFADGGRLLFAINPAGRLYVTGPAFDARPTADWILISLYKPPPEGAASGEAAATNVA